MQKFNRTFWKHKKVLVTGGSGFLGSHLVNLLKELDPKEVFTPGSFQYDLRNLDACKEVVADKDIIIHLAGIVGGIGFNLTNPATMFYDNLIMGIQLMEQARLAGVKKFVAIGTICAYPKFTPIPFKEEDLWNGYPEGTNAPYGLAKKMLLVQTQAYRKQYNFNAIYLLPVNLYGPGDNFDLQSAHVVPSLIRKVDNALVQGENQITVWGTGRPTREFLYVEDAAKGILLATQAYDKPDPVNLGSGMEVSIRELAEKICGIMGFRGEIVFDSSKPDGQPRRRLDVTKAKREFGFSATTSFDKGLKKIIEWYRNNKGKL